MKKLLPIVFSYLGLAIVALGIWLVALHTIPILKDTHLFQLAPERPFDPANRIDFGLQSPWNTWSGMATYMFLGAAIAIISVIIGKLSYFRKPLIIIGVLAILSLSGEYLGIYKYQKDDYFFIINYPNFQLHTNYLLVLVFNLTHLIPGIACIISGIFLPTIVSIRCKQDTLRSCNRFCSFVRRLLGSRKSTFQ